MDEDSDYNYPEVQKKAFGIWVNNQLRNDDSSRVVTDLFFDLRDGVVLLDLLGVLTQRQLKVEKGSLRVHKLKNVDTALNVIRECRCNVDDINSVAIVDGDATATLSLLWAIILHWQFRTVLKHPATSSVNNIERELLTWCQSSVAKWESINVQNFTRSLADGLALLSILHHHKPDLFDVETIQSKNPRDRLDFVFRIMHEHFGVARLLEPEDVHTLTPDKRSVMTYVMCMRQALSHDGAVGEEEDGELNVIETTNLGSPVKNPSKLQSGKLLDYDTFCQLHEDVLEWLLEAEDKLSTMQSLSDELDVVKAQFSKNEDYMSELDAHQHCAVGEIIKKGRHLLNMNLSQKEEKDVRIRIKLLVERWENLRKQALSRQDCLHEKLMTLQQCEMQKLRNWMTLTEDRISRMTIIGCTLKAVQQQEMEHAQLEKSLEDQHSTVHSISNFIYVETESSKASAKSYGGRTSSGDSAVPDDKDKDGEQDLEGQLMALGERWSVLCTWVEERAEILRITRDELELLEKEKTRLCSWLDRREEDLRAMDRNPSEDSEQLSRQGQLISLIQNEWYDEQKAFMNIESVAEKLVGRCLASVSEDTPGKGAIEADCAQIGKAVEVIQDRWDILTEILEAQKQRVTKQGVDLEKTYKPPVAELLREDGGCETSGEESTPKKRRITGTKRIEFEKAFAKAAAFLQSAQKDIDSLANDAGDAASRNAVVTKLEDDVDSWRQEVRDVVRLGDDLMKDIQTEENYPPGYLNNVSEKRAQLESQFASMESTVAGLKTKASYGLAKQVLYENLGALQKVIDQNDQWLKSIDVEKLSENRQVLLQECAAISEKLAHHSEEVSRLKQVASETLQHPGAVDDPTNRIKVDLYTFCERWNALEYDVKEVYAKLAQSCGDAADEKMEEAPAALLTLREIPIMEDELREIESITSTTNADRVSKLRDLIEEAKQYNEDIEGLVLWLDEVADFVKSSDAPFGDEASLESQFQESNALVADIATLLPKFESILATGSSLRKMCSPGSDMSSHMEQQTRDVSRRWEETVNEAKEQNRRLKEALDRSQKLTESLQEINGFTEQLQKDLPPIDKAVNSPADLSQRTFKLLHFRDRIEKKRALLDSIIGLKENSELMSAALIEKISQSEAKWQKVCLPVLDSYKAMKVASMEYGEFKTLSAQESDWLERLEKKLRKSSNTAADAEEISEELDDIENFLHNKPEGRLERIMELAKSLTDKRIRISSWSSEAQTLRARWEDLQKRAKQRTALLENSITEAQEWEYKLIAVQDWLTERDIVLSSHLEHELTVDDLPDETQTMLREFEDQENLLAEMDEQVDAYRLAGKHEAASRLEDQLHLIHERFQELTMKFELFQQQPAVEYEPRLNRISRQLRDIKEKLYLTELASAEKEGIEGQLHHAKCIQNALADIKAEVHSIVKMGRKILETERLDGDKNDLKGRIDALEKSYHDAGSEVVLASRKLNEALSLSERLHTLQTNLQSWMRHKSVQVATKQASANVSTLPFLRDSVHDMCKQRDSLEEIRLIRARFYDMCNPTLLVTLKESVLYIDEEWTRLQESLTELLNRVKPMVTSRQGSDWECLSEIGEKLDELLLSEERKLSTMSQDEAPLLEEFRSAFQEVSQWITSAEAKLGTNRESQERTIGQEIVEWEPKMGDLHKMAERLVQLFIGQQDEVEPEMKKIDQRWGYIVRQVEARLAESKDFKMVEVEEIKTTISHISIPVTEPVLTVTQPSPIIDPDEEILTLPEDNGGGVKSLSAVSPVTPSGPKDRSGDTSPDFLAKGTLSGSGVGESSPKKTPPEPLPKPKWYLEQRARGVQMPLSPEKVKVTTTSLPSPQHLVGRVDKTRVEEPQVPVVTALVCPTSTSSATTTPGSLESPSVSTISSVGPIARIALDDEETPSNDGGTTIDKLLTETRLQLAEVSKQVEVMNAVNTKRHKDHREFEDSANDLLSKIDETTKKVNDLTKEKDLKLRQDLIHMELQQLEGRVSTLFSRGETLALMTRRNNAGMADDIESTLARLDKAWVTLQETCDNKTKVVANCETKLKQLRKDVETIKRWLSAAKVRLVRASNDVQVAKQFVTDVKQKQIEMDHVNATAETLRNENALGGLDMSLTIVNSDWAEICKGVAPLMVHERLNNGSEVSSQSRTASSKTPTHVPSNATNNKLGPEGVASRIEKLMEAIRAVERQLNTQVLNGVRPYENLAVQAEALSTVKNALDRLKPSIRQTDQELERLSGTLSMEYFDRLSAKSATLHSEWERIKAKYEERQAMWVSCQEKVSLVEQKKSALMRWLSKTEAAYASNDQRRRPTAEEIAENGKDVNVMTSAVKEIMCNSSSQDAHTLKEEIDSILERWKLVLNKLNSEKKQASQLSTEVEKLTSMMSRHYNVSDRTVMENTLVTLGAALSSLPDLRNQISQCINNLNSAKEDEAVMKARANIERLAITIPRRVEILKDKIGRLDKVMAKQEETMKVLSELGVKLTKAKQHADPTKRLSQFNTLHLSLMNQQYEVNRILNEYAIMEREVKSHRFEVDPGVASKTQEFKDAWMQLSGEVRRLVTTNDGIQAVSARSVTKEKDPGQLIQSTSDGSLQQNPVSTSPTSATSATSESNMSQMSRTTYSQSSFLSEEAGVVSGENLAAVAEEGTGSLETELHDLLTEATALQLPVHDPANIRRVVERQQLAMRHLESKRDMLDGLMARSRNNSSTTKGYGLSNSSKQQVLASPSAQLKTKIAKLKDQLDVTKHRILSRKTECTAMASDSEQYSRKLNEITTWLTRLESILQSTRPAGQTLDIIEHQHQATMDGLKELSKYDHHIKLFMQVCDRMSSVYAHDNTSEITRSRDHVEQRHKTLVHQFTSRRNELQTVQNSFVNFDKSIERFFEWLFDIESTVENTEMEVSRSNGNSSDSPLAEYGHKVEEIKQEIHDKDRVFNGLINTGNRLLEKMDKDEEMMLSQKLAEISRRWKSLQNKMFDLNRRMQPADKGQVSVIHANLRDHMDWVLRKQRELASLQLGGDVGSLQCQFEEHSSFRHQLRERGIALRASVSSGRILSKTPSDKHDFEECISNLELEWKTLIDRSDEWHDDIIRMLDNVKAFENKCKELDKELRDMEAEMTHTTSLESRDVSGDRKRFDEAIQSQVKDLAIRVENLPNLSQSNKRQFEELIHRASGLEISLPKKAEANDSPLGPVRNQDFLNCNMPKNWERGVAEEGIPYYINHEEELTQWDHPEFSELMETLLEMNTVKYSAYRMALKLRRVQQKLCLDLLDLKSALFGFEEHGLTADKHSSIIRVPEMIVVLTSLYEALQQEEPDEVPDMPLCVDLSLNWLLNVYDSTRCGQMRVLPFKLGILVLCRGPLTEKYIQMFEMVSTDSRMTPRQLGLLLFDAIQIPKVLGEIASFGGSNIEPSVRSCFGGSSGLDLNVSNNGSTTTNSQPPAGASIDCKEFLKWLQQEPQSILWLPVLHRLASAETATHDTKCKACKAYPIVGFRYNCLKCFNFDLCHDCFFVGLTAKGHKPDHPMQEYCTSTGRSANLKILGQAFRNSFRTKKYFKKKKYKLGYLPVGSLTDGDEFLTPPVLTPNMSQTSRNSPSSQNRNSGGSHLKNASYSTSKLRSSNECESPFSGTTRTSANDEHHLIAEYCQYLYDNDKEESPEISTVANLTDLQRERKALMAEYNDLARQAGNMCLDEASRGEHESIGEKVKELRQQTTRMETRMEILHDHNSQLQRQLERLRSLVRQQQGGHLAVLPRDSGGGGQFGTLQSKSVIAQDLNDQSPSKTLGNTNSDGDVQRRLPPPHGSRENNLNGSTSDEDENSLDHGKSSSQSSLDLSAHETQSHNEDSN